MVEIISHEELIKFTIKLGC